VKLQLEVDFVDILQKKPNVWVFTMYILVVIGIIDSILDTGRDATDFKFEYCQIPPIFVNPKSYGFSDSFGFRFSFRFGNPKFIIRRNSALTIQN